MNGQSFISVLSTLFLILFGVVAFGVMAFGVMGWSPQNVLHSG